MTCLVILCILNALVTLLTFILYVRARMTVREEEPDSGGEQHAGRIAELDRKEQLYRSIHFITLFAFVVLGVIILVILSGRLNDPDRLQ